MIWMAMTSFPYEAWLYVMTWWHVVPPSLPLHSAHSYSMTACAAAWVSWESSNQHLSGTIWSSTRRPTCACEDTTSLDLPRELRNEVLKVLSFVVSCCSICRKNGLLYIYLYPSSCENLKSVAKSRSQLEKVAPLEARKSEKGIKGHHIISHTCSLILHIHIIHLSTRTSLWFHQPQDFGPWCISHIHEILQRCLWNCPGKHTPAASPKRASEVSGFWPNISPHLNQQVVGWVWQGKGPCQTCGNNMRWNLNSIYIYIYIQEVEEYIIYTYHFTKYIYIYIYDLFFPNTQRIYILT